MDKRMNKSKAPTRQYPVLYEKLVPVAIGLIVVVILALLVIIFGVALDVWANPV
jgi:hypothetical protein